MVAERRATVGFTVKSGWASAVLVCGTPASPQVADSRRVELNDPSVPDSRQPYHEGFGTARREGPELSRLLASVEDFGQRSVTALLQHFQAGGYALVGAGVVVGSLTPPDAIHNDHIRIHALEGQLFRRVIEEGLRGGRVSSSIWRERDLYGLASKMLKQPEPALRVELTALGKTVEGPWRVEQKAATLAAWLRLAVTVGRA
ncbi:MAG: hypothetical protein DMF89_11930 [Acidobacteria bacterium]|nr:MAG: hypothetical protein DMF90_14530 [Acidobacteriota bacterium]PYR49717.1 MAG: hypothetical protein DMF89_11930 [Acidobacteriota bacterium]